MAHHNSASSSATQYNVGIQIAPINNHYHLISQATSIATAQQFGSPIDTRYSYAPLNQMIQAVNSGDIIAKRYHGEGIYDKMKGMIINAFGFREEKMMEDIIMRDGENPTQLSTLIVCLSVALTKTTLCQVVSSAIMLFSHNELDNSMLGELMVIRNQVEKYANAVLSRDAMCNKLEHAKIRVKELVKGPTLRLKAHTLFLPPRLPAEEGDFVEFIVKLWSSQTDGDKIYIRSVKLLSLALLLSEYGWNIDVFVENDDQVLIPIQTDTRALSVIYSSTTVMNKDREYVENHHRHVGKRGRFNSTAVCRLAHIGEVTGRSLTKNEANQFDFMQGYNLTREFCKSAHFRVHVDSYGIIQLTIDLLNKPRRIRSHESCEKILERCIPKIPEKFMDVITLALHHAFPQYDWTILYDKMAEQMERIEGFTYILEHFEGNARKLWSLMGAIISALDHTVLLFVNNLEECQVRITVGESLDGANGWVSKCYHCLGHLLLRSRRERDMPRTRSVEMSSGERKINRIIQLCATRLAGAMTIEDSALQTIGYWNAQQGLILTTIFERVLYDDLPCKSKLLTFYYIPMMGIPVDKNDWIKIGRVEPAMIRLKRIPRNNIESQHDVIMEYRPDFERDPNTVVAGVCVNGVFSHLLELNNRISHERNTISRCSWRHDSVHDEEQPATRNYITLDSFEPGEAAMPPEDEIAIVGPHYTKVSKLFSYLVYKPFQPVIQDGCLSCAIMTAKKNGSRIVISKIREMQGTSPPGCICCKHFSEFAY